MVAEGGGAPVIPASQEAEAEDWLSPGIRGQPAQPTKTWSLNKFFENVKLSLEGW
jgi:hypothetical protein